MQVQTGRDRALEGRGRCARVVCLVDWPITDKHELHMLVNNSSAVLYYAQHQGTIFQTLLVLKWFQPAK